MRNEDNCGFHLTATGVCFVCARAARQKTHKSEQLKHKELERNAVPELLKAEAPLCCERTILRDAQGVGLILENVLKCGATAALPAQ